MIAALLAMALGAGSVSTAPCLLGPNDQPLNCPNVTLPTPKAAPVAPKPRVCRNPKTKAPIKCPPVMLAPHT
jgi:hypothetical protein